MTRVLSVLLVLVLVWPAFAQPGDTVAGSGEVISDTRELGEFDEIELDIAADVSVKIGKPTPLEIQGDDNILPLIKTKVVDGRLVVSADRSFKTKQTLVLKLTVANLKAAEVRGSGDMHIAGIDNPSLQLALKGSGDLQVTGKTGQLAVSVAGAGDVKLTGKADQLAVSVAGSGDVKAFDLDALSATVSIKGSGDAKVSVQRSLTIQIAGSGDVHYKGNPQVVQQIQGSGDVKRHE